jgi:hypothetical protein
MGVAVVALEAVVQPMARGEHEIDVVVVQVLSNGGEHGLCVGAVDDRVGLNRGGVEDAMAAGVPEVGRDDIGVVIDAEHRGHG